MASESEDKKILLPHHAQQALCTTRLAYRQGRKLTAVKVYTINNESRHLLIFGVPSLNLRQETKALFTKFGKLSQFYVSTEHKCEAFTETYHAAFENIHHARIAKRLLDTKNFYGSSLHVCYAPEYETIDDTRQKLLLRKQDVITRLRNLEREKLKKTSDPPEIINESPITNPIKLNMGEVNTIGVAKQMRDILKGSLKRKSANKNKVVIEKKFRPCFTEISEKNKEQTQIDNPVTDIVDCTSTEKATITNIDLDKTLNYNNFGNEIIRKVPEKSVNKIIFMNKNR